MDLVNSKNKIIDEINTIIESYQSIETSHSNEMKLFTGEVERLNQFNNKLLSEIREKDKILSTQEKTIHDYSVMINELQEKSTKELSDKEKFDMIKAQDKEIHLRDQKIKDLEKKIEELTSNKKKTNDKSKTLVEKMKDITESQKDDKEVVEVVEEEKKQLQRSKSEEELLLTGDIVDERTPSEIEEDNQNSELQKVIEDDKVEKPKESSSDDDDDDETSDDELEVEIITHYKKDYYIKTNEKNPQYIYAIDDGDIGDIVGELKGKKKILYDK
jgi:uncharacterized coiled-coil protein SlyX